MVFILMVTAPPEIYTLSLHDALPIYRRGTDQIFDDRVESELRRPSSRASQLGRIADEDWHLGRANQRSVGVQYRIEDRKSTRLNSSHSQISYAVFCLKKKTT